MNFRLEIAATIIIASTIAFLAAYLANGWTQIRTTGLYVPPGDLIDIVKLCFGAGLAVLTIGSMAQAHNALKKLADNKEENDDQS